IVDSLEQFDVQETFITGERVAKDGKYLLEITRANTDAMENSVHLKDFSQVKLDLKLTSDRAPAIEVIKNEALTDEAIVEVTRDEEGMFVHNTAEDITKIAVIERHHLTGNAFVALLKNYGLKRGAIATSIAHDSHNLVVTGTNDADMTLAI